MSRLRRYTLAGAALMLCAVAPARLSAQTALIPGGLWAFFSYFSGVGPIDDLGADGFTVTSMTDQVRVRVTDLFFAGDSYDIYLDGAPFAQTPSVFGTDFVTGDPDLAFGNADLSWVELLLDPRPTPYLITLNVRETAPGFDFGDGAIRADIAPPPGAPVGPIGTPEPTTLALLATGLTGLGAAHRRRRQSLRR